MHPAPDEVTPAQPASGRRRRRALTGLVAAALAVALVGQRHTVTAATAELGRLGVVTLVALAGLAVLDRLVRGLMIRRAVGGLTPVEGLVMHDVGAAASYGLPGGGVVGTGLRYHVARTAHVDGATFLAGLTAYGIAISATTWFLPMAVLGLETAGGQGGVLDLSLMAACAAVLGGTTMFWVGVLRSDRVLELAVRLGERGQAIVGRRRASVTGHDVRSGLVTLRDRLRAVLPRIPALVAGAVCMQLIAAGILLVALSGLGATGELGVLEFARVFFVTRVLGSIAPTPGGVGVIEAGMTAAIASAGVPLASAAGAVLVFRLATYVLPIMSGACCWLLWRHRPVGESRPQAVIAA